MCMQDVIPHTVMWLSLLLNAHMWRTAERDNMNQPDVVLTVVCDE